MNAVIIFVVAFLLVFALGLQSLLVNSGRAWIAAANSAMIGLFNVVILKVVPDAQSATEIVAYIMGGPFAVFAAIKAHRAISRWADRHALRRAEGGGK